MEDEEDAVADEVEEWEEDEVEECEVDVEADEEVEGVGALVAGAVAGDEEDDKEGWIKCHLTAEERQKSNGCLWLWLFTTINCGSDVYFMDYCG